MNSWCAVSLFFFFPKMKVHQCLRNENAGPRRATRLSLASLHKSVCDPLRWFNFPHYGLLEKQKKEKRIERVWKKKERLPWKFSSELAFTVMGKNECKLNCSQAGSNRRQLLLSQVTCFIYKDMWATMLLSEREEKRKERVVAAAAAAAWGGLHTLVSSESSWECSLKMYQRLNMQMSRRLTLELTTVFKRRAAIIVGSYSSLLMALIKMGGKKILLMLLEMNHLFVLWMCYSCTNQFVLCGRVFT